VKLYRNSPKQKVSEPYGGIPDVRQEARLRLLKHGFIVVFCIIALRLFMVHLNPRLELTEEDKFHVGEIILEEPRGEIFDRNGLLLATNYDVPSLWADPRYIKDPHHLALVLSHHLNMDEEQVFQRLTARDSQGNPRKFVWIKRWLTDIPEPMLFEFEKMGEGGIHIRKEPIRYYPQGDTAAHLLGFVNRAGEASEGVELTFDHHLKSEPGRYIARKDVHRRLLSSLTLDHIDPEGGDDIVLTIDAGIQLTLERELDRRIEEVNALSAMGILMDPKTGAILALANRPAFDPNHYDLYDPELRKNSAIIDVFEPGSVFKIVVTSAAIEHGLITPDTMINCENGFFNPYGHRIRDYYKLGVVPFSKSFEMSSNIAMIKIAALLGPERFEDWIRRFGFGQVSSSQFTLESVGIFRPRSQWSRLSMGSLPMGQEIAVTMPQLARAFSVVANGGYLVEPYFIERAVDREGIVTYRHQLDMGTRILSENTARTMLELCHGVVMKGSGSHASIDEYRVGGKTGTAQMARAGGGGYEKGRYTTVFAGFAPVNDPRIVAIIVVQEPQNDFRYGGYVCGPVFKEVVRDALIRMNVPKDPVKTDRKNDNDTILVADPDAIVERPSRVLMAQMEASEANSPEFIEFSLEDLLEPLDGVELAVRNSDVIIDGARGLPDFTGLTKRQVKEMVAQLSLSIDLRGAGWAVSQDPAPGTPLQQIALCAVVFSTGSQDETDDIERDI